MDQNENNLESNHRYKIAYEEVVIVDFKNALPFSICPKANQKRKCGAIGGLSFHTKYKRAVIRDIVNGEIIEYYDVNISRFICSQCNTTHALLVWFLPPWSRHTLRFILFVLEMYYLGTITVEALCAKFDITHPTLYTWAKKYSGQCDDLRRLFNPPLLPDVPLRFEKWENTEDLISQDIPPCDPSQPNTQTDKVIEDTHESIPDTQPAESVTFGKRQGLLSAFEEKVFRMIKSLVEQDTSSVFKDFYTSYHVTFFQARQILGCAGRTRASPDGR